MSQAARVKDNLEDSYCTGSHLYLCGVTCALQGANIFKRWMESDCYCPVGLVCWETFQFQTTFCTSILLVVCLKLNRLKAPIIIHSHLAHHVRNDLQ